MIEKINFFKFISQSLIKKKYSPSVLTFVGEKVNYKYGINGNYIKLVSVSKASDYVDIKVNAPGNDTIRLYVGMCLVCPIGSIYIDAPVTNGEVSLVYGSDPKDLNYINGSVGLSLLSSEFRPFIRYSDDIEAGDTTGVALWTPASGKRFVITRLVISCSAAGVVVVYDNTDDVANRIIKLDLGAQGGYVGDHNAKPSPSAAVDNKLYFKSDGSFTGTITVEGYEL